MAKNVITSYSIHYTKLYDTQNALYAADRVIVPVKDAPSLENCRNLYDFFEAHGLSKRPLRLLPCLIDSRIRYDGPFRDPYRLLKGYAINRGYRCIRITSYNVCYTKLLRDEGVGQADGEDPGRHLLGGEQLEDRRTEAPGKGVLLDGYHHRNNFV